MAVTAAALLAACTSGPQHHAAPRPPSPTHSEQSPTPTPSPTPSPVPGGTFHDGVAGQLGNWNIDTTGGQSPAAQAVLQQVYPPAFLLGPRAGQLRPNPSVVSSATVISSIPFTVRYELAPGARWSDKVPVGAADFRYVWRVSNGRSCRQCHPASTIGYSDIAKVSAAPGAVDVVFRHTYSDWQALFGNGSGLLPAHIAGRHGGLARSFRWFTRHVPVVSAGPFAIRTANRQRVLMVRNPRYAGTAALVHRLVIDRRSSPASAIASVGDGSLDAAAVPVTATAAKAARSISTVRTSVEPTATSQQLVLNLRSHALADRALRVALLTVIDRADLLSAADHHYPGVSLLDNRFFVPGTPNYADDVTSTRVGSGNLGQAKDVLSGASYRGIGTTLYSPTGKRVPELVLTYAQDDIAARAEAPLIASEASQLGITITPEAVGGDPSAVSLVRAGDVALVDEPGSDFPTLAAPRYLSSSATNVSGYANPQVDHFLSRASRAAEAVTAAKDVNAADLLLSQDGQSLPIFEVPELFVVRNGWLGLTANVTVQGPPFNASRWGRAS